eukprot:375018_1
MGNKVDPRCQEIYDQYKTCYDTWKKDTDWRQYHHEGESEECNEMLQAFKYCTKEQVARMTGYVPAKELMKIRDEVKEKQEQEKLEQNNTSDANTS